MINVKDNVKVGVVSGLAVTGIIYLMNKIGIKEIDKIDRYNVSASESELKVLELELENEISKK